MPNQSSIAISNTPLTPAQSLNLLIEEMMPDLRLLGARTHRAMVAAGRVRERTQTTWDWNVTFDGADTGIGRTEDVTVENNTDERDKARLEIGDHKVYHRFNVNRVALQEAQSKGPQAIRDLFGELVYAGMQRINKRLNTLLYKGDGTAAMAGYKGLNSVYNDATYAGISGITRAKWNAILQLSTDAVNRPFSRDLMRSFDTLVSNEEAMYNTVLMHPRVAEAYSKVYDDVAGTKAVYGDENNALPMQELGYGGKSFNNLPVLEDPEADQDLIYCLNRESLFMGFFLLDNDPSSPNVNPIAVNRSLGYPLHIAELPSAVSTVRTIEMYVIPQLKVSNRRSLLGIGELDAELNFA